MKNDNVFPLQRAHIQNSSSFTSKRYLWSSKLDSFYIYCSTFGLISPFSETRLQGTKGVVEVTVLQGTKGVEVMVLHGTKGVEVMVLHGTKGVEVMVLHGTKGVEVMVLQGTIGVEVMVLQGTIGAEVMVLPTALPTLLQVDPSPCCCAASVLVFSVRLMIGSF
jgi:hypothetical protein